MEKIVNEYIEKGWEAPLPLPSGAKFPPPKGTTGAIPPIKRDDLKNLWSRSRGDSNIGLRSQVTGDYDVIFIDVDEDQQKGKFGGFKIQELQIKYGDLNLRNIPRSSRRGPESVGAQYPFLVPSNYSWRGNAEESIDIIQFKHRYTVVYPSVVDGMEYKWYIGSEEIEIPHVEEIPILPDKWVNYLSNGNLVEGINKGASSFAKSAKHYSGSGRYIEAINWLRDNMPEYGVEDRASERFRKIMDQTTLKREMSHNAHDTLIRKVQASVKLAAEGNPGLKQALRKIKSAFMREVLSEGRRTDEEAKREYENAVIGAVERLSAEVDMGKVKIFNYDEAEITSFRSASANPDGKVTIRGFDLSNPSFSDSDAGSARLFTDFWRDNVLATNESKGQEFAVWSDLERRFRFHSKNQMYRLVEQGVSERIEIEIDNLLDQIETLQARIDEGQLPAKEKGEQDPEDLMKYVNKLRAWADRARSTQGANNILAQTHSDPNYSVDIGEFNTQHGIVGLLGGQTLDTKSLLARETYVRWSTQTDMLTMSANTMYSEDPYHGAWQKFLDQFLPNPEIRRFVQKVLGYTLLDGNPRKIMVFLVGESNTGKTTILEACASALGDYASNMNANKLFRSNDGGPSPELVNNASKLMVFLSEVGNTHHLSADAIKQVTGGDTIQARKLYSNDTTARKLRFTPYASTNTPPQIEGGDAALRERIVALPFNHVNTEIPTFEMNVVENEAVRPAILHWLIEGLKLYRDEGLLYKNYPQQVKDLMEEFVSETSYLSRFLRDATEEYTYTTKEEKKDRPDIPAVYSHFRNWAMNNHLDRRDIINMVDFQREILAITKNRVAFRTTRGKKKNVWVFNLKLV